MRGRYFYQPIECMANVGVGFSQDWWPRARIGGLEIARLAVMGVLGDVPGDPLLFHGYPRVPMKKPDGPELACHRAELIPSSNVGKWEPQKGGGARSAPPPIFRYHCLMVSAQLYGMPAQAHLAFSWPPHVPRLKSAGGPQGRLQGPPRRLKDPTENLAISDHMVPMKSRPHSLGWWI